MNFICNNCVLKRTSFDKILECIMKTYLISPASYFHFDIIGVAIHRPCLMNFPWKHHKATN